MSSRSLVAIEAGTLYTPTERISPARMILDGNAIAEVGSPRDVRIPAAARRVDASPFIVAPGFIDPHIHGGGGVDVMEGTYESLNTVSRMIARHGTTSFLPTTVSSPPDDMAKAVAGIGSTLSRTFEGAQPLGIHLEGPFISPAKRGTHKAGDVSAPDPALFLNWVRASNDSIRLITIAPELEGIEAVCRLAQESGVAVAMGHSNASFEESSAAAKQGVCYAVHTFNAMRGFSHRDPGILGTVLADDRIFAEIIADGIHVDPPVVRIFARAKGKSRVVLATDAISAAGMPDGRYALGCGKVDVVNGTCRDAEGRLAGSTLAQDAALRNFLAWTDFALDEALMGLTLNPARALQLERKGVLEPGADADFVFLDEILHVVQTFVGGRLVWTS